MADELRTEALIETVADGTTISNSGTEFRNDSSRIIFIRKITVAAQWNTAANDETCAFEISKSVALQMTTNQNSRWHWPHRMGILGGTTGAALDDVAITLSDVISFGRGQLTLEPGESMFTNTAKSSGGTLTMGFVIYYHF